MRKLSLAMMGIATAALMTMVSCRKPVNGLVTPGETRTVTFTAVTENGNGSKTAISDHDIFWKTGDKISVNGEEMTLASGDGTTSGTFTGDISATAPYYIGYPSATTKYTASPQTFSVGIPSSWTYDANNVVVPMAAYTNEEGNISFYNAVNVLKLKLKGTSTDAENCCKLTSIMLSHPSVNLNGDITVNFDGDGKPTFSAASNGTKTMTVSFGEGLQLYSNVENEVYIMLPKIESGDISITLNCANTGYMEKKLTHQNEFNEVNHLISNSVALTVNAVVETDEEINFNYPAIGITGMKIWAKYNVGANVDKILKDPEHAVATDWYGKYYAWGETTAYGEIPAQYDESWTGSKNSGYLGLISGNAPKTTYTFNYYKWGTGKNDIYKYTIADGLLGDEDNVAKVESSNFWDMPTKADWGALIANTYWVWIQDYAGISGLKGLAIFKVKSDLDKGSRVVPAPSKLPYSTESDPHLFLPASGVYTDEPYGIGSTCYYWSKKVSRDNIGNASDIYYENGQLGWENANLNRCCGLTIRPVR